MSSAQFYCGKIEDAQVAEITKITEMEEFASNGVYINLYCKLVSMKAINFTYFMLKTSQDSSTP